MRNESHYEEPLVCIQSRVTHHTPRTTRHIPNPFKKKYRGLTLPLCTAGAHLGLMQFVHSSTRVPVASVQLLCITSVSLTLLTHLQILFFGPAGGAFFHFTFSHTPFYLAFGMFTIVRYHLYAFRLPIILYLLFSNSQSDLFSFFYYFQKN